MKSMVGNAMTPGEARQKTYEDMIKVKAPAAETPVATETAPTVSKYTNQMAEPKTLENGNSEIRQSLVSRGVDTGRIGWNDATKTVTLDGKDYITPSEVRDGVAYTDKKQIDQMTHKAYESMGDALVSASQYGAGAGFGNAVKWDGASGMLSVGGEMVKPVYVSDDGIAYVKKSDMDSAISKTKEAGGVKGPREIYNDWESKYGTQAEADAQAIRDFNYAPEKDAAFKAYSDYMMREKMKLAEDAAARAMDASGGYGGMNVERIANSLFNSQQEIGEAIPQYEQMAYKRLLNNLDTTRTLGNDAYSRASAAENDAYTRLNNALADDYSRRITEQELDQKEKEWGSVNFRNKVDDALYPELAALNRDYQRESAYSAMLANDSQVMNMVNALVKMGGTVDKDMAGSIGVRMRDGSFISLNDIANNI